jgi:hypothetical protein
VSHEPECPYQPPVDYCFRHMIRKSREPTFPLSILNDFVRESYNKGYRDGYNDHAKSRAYAEAVYGPYVQHGQGENP